MKDVYVILVLATATLLSLTTADDNLQDEARDARLISTFQIVRFPNDACISSTTRNGTCYTSAECSDKGGSSGGSCADGFGVCCTFVVQTCGQSASENITYWESPTTVAAGECRFTLNTISDNICQLRLDFTTFVITGPSTNAVSEQHFGPAGFPGGLAGNVGAIATNQGSWATNCLTDSFSVSSPNPANKPPTICGVNTGYHMYVDMDSQMSTIMSFAFQTNPGGADALQDTRGVPTLANRAWAITALQYECGYINSAPPGCTNYYWSDSGAQVGGWLESYNFVGGTKHLANQNQKFCIRRERNVCWAAFYRTNAIGAFNLSGNIQTAVILGALTVTQAGQPCGYICSTGTGAGIAANTCSYDCVIIPGQFVVAALATGIAIGGATAAQVRLGIAAATNHSPAPPQVGGHGIFGGNVAVGGAAAANGDAAEMTTFTKHYPFQVTFKSDSFEGLGTLAENLLVTQSVGLKLSYDLITCT